MNKLPKRYSEVVDEWLQWKKNDPASTLTVADYAKQADAREGANLRQAAYDPNFAQKLFDYSDRAMRLPTGVKDALMMLTPAGPTMAFGQQLVNGPDAVDGKRFSDVGAGYGAVAGRALDTATEKLGYTVGPLGPEKVEGPVEPRFEPALEEVGRMLPRGAAQTAVMAAGGLPGFALGLADTALSAYAPYKDPVAGAVAPATQLVGFKTIPLAGRAAERMAADAVLPDFQDLVQAPTAEFGRQSAEMFGRKVLGENLVSGARIGAEAAAGTVLNEASRQAESVMRGEGLAPITPEAVAANVVGTAAFAPLDIATRRPPGEVLRERAFARYDEASQARGRREALSQTRGRRIGETHQKILAASAEEVPSLLEELRSHYVEAAAWEAPTRETAERILMALSDEADSGRMPPEKIAHLIASVRGRFNEIVESDPTTALPGGETLSELVNRGLLPRITDDWLKTNLKEAYEQALGDDPTALANLVNRVFAHYAETAPSAVEAYKKLPRAEELTKSSLDAKTEADKDAAYINALLKLQPHMKGKLAPGGALAPDGTLTPGSKRLDEAMYERDMEMSEATQGSQLSSASTAWSRYDAWKDAVIKMAETFDPVTRQGIVYPKKRLSDGTVLELPGQPVTLEEMVARRPGTKNYEFTVTPTSKKGRAGSSSLLRDAMELFDERLGKAEDDEEGTVPQERRLGERKREMGTTPEGRLDLGEQAQPKTTEELPVLEEMRGADWKPTEKSPQEVVTAWREATELGLRGDDRANYVKAQYEAMRNVDSPALGVDLVNNKREAVYDAALYLINKIERTDNAELWQRYGGERTFGQGAKSVGKFELFKDAILAKLEHDADPTGKMHANQLRFIQRWRELANQKSLESINQRIEQLQKRLTELPEGPDRQRVQQMLEREIQSRPAEFLEKVKEKKGEWAALRQDAAHSLRLYWRQIGNRFDDFFLGMLDDRPEYQKVLRGTQAEKGEVIKVDFGPKPQEKDLLTWAKQQPEHAARVRRLRDFIGSDRILNQKDIDVIESEVAHALWEEKNRGLRAQPPGEPIILGPAENAGVTKGREVGGAFFEDVPAVIQRTRAGTGNFEIGEVYQWTHPNPKLQQYNRNVIVAGPAIGDKIPVYSITSIGASPELTPKSELSVPKSPDVSQVKRQALKARGDPDIQFTQTAGMADPVADAARLFRGYVRKQGFDEGYASDAAQIAAKMVMAFDEASAVGKIVSPTDAMGMNIQGDKGPLIGLKLDKIARDDQPAVTNVVRALQILAHELAHNYSDINRPKYNSMYRKQRTDAYQTLRAMFDTMGPEATVDLMDNIIEPTMIPAGFRPEYKTSLQHGNFSQEAVSRLMEYVMLGAFTKDSPWQVLTKQKADTFTEAFHWTPDEVVAFTNLAFRDLLNFTKGIEHVLRVRINAKETDATRRQNLSKTLQLLRPMMTFAEKYLDTVPQQHAEYATVAKTLVSKLSAAGSADWQDPIIVRTNQLLEQDFLNRMAEYDKVAYAIPELRETQQTLFGDEKLEFQHERRLGRKTPTWSKWFSLLYQHMRRYESTGVPLAEPAMRIIDDLEPAFGRLSRMMHEGFLTTDKNGRTIYDPNHPVQRILQNKHPQSVQARQAMNKLVLWANTNKTPVTLPDEQGRTSVNPKAQQIVKDTLGKLDPVMQQGVLEGIASLQQGYKKAADLFYGAQMQSTAFRMAKLMMTVDRGMTYEPAMELARVAVENAVRTQEMLNTVEQAKTDTPLLVPQLQQELLNQKAMYDQSLAQLTPDQRGSFKGYMEGPGGLAQKLLELNKMLQSHEGWFTSESRPGRVFIVSKDKAGNKHYDGARNELHAKQIREQLMRLGHTDFEFIDKRQQDAQQLYDSPDAIVDSFIKLEREAWAGFLHKMRDKLDDNAYSVLEEDIYVPGQTSQRFIQNKSLEKYMRPQKQTLGRERLDAFEVFSDYSSRMAGTIARRGLREQIDLLLRDPRVRKDGDFQQTVRQAMDTLLTPVGDDFTTARAAITSYFLGFNLTSPLIEGSQALTTILPYFVRENGFSNGLKYFTKAPLLVAERMRKQNTFEEKSLIARAKQKEGIDPRAMTKDESLAYYYKRALDEGILDYGAIQQTMFSRDHELLAQHAFGIGKTTPKTRAELLRDKVYWTSQLGMWLYSATSGFNNRATFLASLENLYDKGFRGVELYQKARAFKNLATFGGGKANEIGYVGQIANHRTRSSFALVNTLQRYSFGIATMYKDFIADALGRTDLTPMERKQAGAAVATAAAATAALGGAMALPGMAIMAAVLQQLFGYDAKQEAREMVFDTAKALDAEDPMAVATADVAMNGLAGHWMGLDVSSRLGMNQFIGFNAYDGFNVSDLFGPGYGVVEGLVNAGRFAAKGDMVQAGKSLAPPSLRPAIDITANKSRYGDTGMRDNAGNLLYEPSRVETALYAAGIRPYAMRKRRDAQQALFNAKDRFQTAADQKKDRAAQEMLRGNDRPAFELAQEYVRSAPGADPKEALQAVINRAVAATNERDLLATVSLGNDEKALEIARSFGDAMPRRNELDQLMQREMLNARIGYSAGQPADSKALVRAALIDALTAKRADGSPGMTRGDAARMVSQMGY